MNTRPAWLVAVLSAVALAAPFGGADAHAAPSSSTTTTISVVQLGKDGITCGATSTTFSVALVGGSQGASTGNIKVTRFDGTNQVVTLPYSLGQGQKKSYSIAVPYTVSCSAPPPRFAVSLDATTGGWDGKTQNVSPVAIGYGSDDSKLTLTANGTSSPRCGDALTFSAKFDLHYTGPSGTVSVTRSDSGQSVSAAYSGGSGASATATIGSSWQLDCTAAPPSFATKVVAGTGGGLNVNVTPKSFVYAVSSTTP